MDEQNYESEIKVVKGSITYEKLDSVSAGCIYIMNYGENRGSIRVVNKSRNKGIYYASFISMRPEEIISDGFDSGEDLRVEIRGELDVLTIAGLDAEKLKLKGKGEIVFEYNYISKRTSDIIDSISSMSSVMKALGTSTKEAANSFIAFNKSVGDLEKALDSSSSPGFDFKGKIPILENRFMNKDEILLVNTTNPFRDQKLIIPFIPDDRTAKFANAINFRKIDAQQKFKSLYQQEVLGSNEPLSRIDDLDEIMKPNIEEETEDFNRILNKVTPPEYGRRSQLSGLKTSLLGWCCKCDKPVDEISSQRNVLNGKTYLEAKCHGESDKITITSMDLISMEAKSKFRRMDFFKSDKKEEKKEIKAPIGKRKLL
jgi:hypothetical protein